MTILYNLLQITIYSTILYAAVMLFKTLFQKHASPLLGYLIWFLLIARLLIPITPDLGFSFITLPAVQMQEETAQYPAPVPTDAVFSAGQPAPSTAADSYSNSTDTAEQATAALPVSIIQPEFDAARFLLLLWITGAAFFLLRFMIESFLLKRRLLQESAPPPSEVTLLAEKILSELHLKRKIKIVVLKGLESPVLSINFRPVVILPERLLTRGETQIEYALRHELMHEKRADHLVCMLILVLRAVYWFHPVAWLMSRQMKLDMETACDCMVVKSMSPGQKKDYAGTILNMYACEGRAGLLLGMGLKNTRKTAERRIRGIFMRQRTGNRIKALTILLSAILTVTCFTSACQPTHASPDATGTAQAEQANAAAPETALSYQVPSEWKQTVQYGGLTIDVDTPVLMPDVNAYPVVRVEPAAFSQEQTYQIVKYFTADNFTKEAEMQQLEKVLEEGAHKNHWGVSVGDENGISKWFDWRNTGDGNLYSRFVYSTEFYRDYQTETFYNQNKEWIQNPGLRKVEYEELFNGIRVSRKGAQAQAQKVIDDLNIGDMQLAGIQKAVLLGYDLNNDNKGDSPDKGGYLFEYTRSPGGISGYDLTDDSQPDTQGEFCPAYPFENIAIIVTDNGVEYFNWNGYCNVVKTENENAVLAPFEQIQQKLLEQINTKRSRLLNNSSMEGVRITVNSAQLRVGLIQSEDDFFQSLMVPVWVFETKETYSLANGKTTHSYLAYMIDATNGVEIDRVSGYGGAQR